jgi:putative SOS response-associated peptidase YedK
MSSLSEQPGSNKLCGRYSLTASGKRLAAEFGIEELASWLPKYNIAPTQQVPALVDDDGKLAGVHLHWGLVPAWAKDRKIGSRLINARAETVAQKPSFRNAMRKSRCLVLADGYYEWVKQSTGKQPIYIFPKDGRVFAFAGLHEQWRDANSATYSSCTIITCAPNSDIEPLHHRMPVILPPEKYSIWLAAKAPIETLEELLKPSPNGTLTTLAVSTFVNSPAHEGPDCIAAQ